jgi:hypothetical protein
VKPATPLPWKPFGPFVIDENENEVASGGYGIDAAYIAHACNLYPELVEALEQLCKAASDEWTDSWEWFDRARAVLAKCRVEP